MTRMTAELIAPCGMNCALCASYLEHAADVPKKAAKVPHCAGCRPRDKQCAFIKKRCAKIGRKEIDFCFECGEMPCTDLLRVDKLYRTRYGMSMVTNLEFLRAKGMAAFLRRQKKEHACAKCGGIVCVHNGECCACGAITGPRMPLEPIPKQPVPRA
jgi:hypothetical protein